MTGPPRTAAGRLLPVFLVLLVAFAVPVRAPAQDAVCTLPLPVPESSQIQITLQPTARGPGVLLTWPELTNEASTCVALLDTAGLGIPVSVSGHYTDSVDRMLRFEFAASGTIGDPARDRFVGRWLNLNVARTGRIGGEINLSNTGGLWVRQAGGNWIQRNAGLPMTLPYTNLVDLAAAGDGTLLAFLSSGSQVDVNPSGLYRRAPGGTWTEIAPATFGRARNVSRLAVHPGDAARFAAGTRTSGLFVTTDGGASFTQWTSNLDPAFSPMPTQFEVTALTRTASRLYAAIANFGLFVSADDGASFTRLANLTVPGPGGAPLIPRVRRLVVDPADGDRLVAGLFSNSFPASNGIYESRDGGQSWQSLNGSFVPLPGGGNPAPDAPKVVSSIVIDPAAGDRMVIGTDAQGFWYTTDGGAVWYEAASPFTNDPVKPAIWDIVRHEGALVAQVLTRGLYQSLDDGQTWTTLADQPFNSQGRRLLSTPAGLLLATNGGGIYVPGAPISIAATSSTAQTDPQWRNLEFGLFLAFGAGAVTLTDVAPDGSLIPKRFRLNAQDFQGWIVWRAQADSPDDMVMIGRYDKNNPETCIEGYCGDDTYVVLPNCFSERRAACFDFGQPGRVSFYDDDIFNGFTYHYAVTPFDFGDTSLLSDPVDLVSPMVFPARFAGDPLAEGPGNRITYQVNLAPTAAVDGAEIYVYPNPLRLGAGIVGGEGEQVVWTNLPPESRIEVFTVAGDRIAELPLPGEPQQGANIYWVTRNQDNRLLAAGIYIWRVVMPQRGDFWGKLVIIR